MPELDEAIFVVLGATAERLRSLLGKLPDAYLNTPVDDGWAVRDALSHLLDTESVIAGRIREIVDEDRPFIRSIDPRARLREGGYASRPVAAILDEFSATRTDGLRWLETLTATQLDRVGDHDEAGPISGRDIAHQWAYHDLMHLKQIESMLQSRLEPGMRNALRFYSDV